MSKARKLSHSTQRKRLMNRHKVKMTNRRINHFIQDNICHQQHASSLS